MFTKIVFNSRLNITKISHIENAVATHVVIVFRTVTVKKLYSRLQIGNKMHAFRLRKKLLLHVIIVQSFDIFKLCFF